MLSPKRNISDARIIHVSTLDYISLIRLSYEAILEYRSRFDQDQRYTFPYDFIRDLHNHVKIDRTFLVQVVLVSICWTILRHYITQRPTVQKLNLPRIYAHKFPESVWKFSFYVCAWSLSTYILIFSDRYTIFWDPISIWKDWAPDRPIHWDIYVIYVVQASFYLHSIPATLFMDLWRKDSVLMLVHHVLTLALIALSYGTNHVQEGVLIFFLHDNTDMLLEVTKLCVYSKRRHGHFDPILHHIGNIAFVLFAVLWFLFRLYWYPLKLLYTVIYAPIWLAPPDAPFYPVFVTMLVLLFAMNLYWFRFIVKLIIRVWQTGEELEDNREFDTTAVSGIPKEELEKIAEQMRHSSSGESWSRKRE